MKSLIMAAVFVLAGVAQAQAETIVCGLGRYAEDSQPAELTMTLTSLGKTVYEVQEGVSVPYSLVLKNGDKTWMDVRVKASSEDVVFSFTHRSRQYGDIEGVIYMDELDQTSLTVNGTTFSFNCGQ